MTASLWNGLGQETGPGEAFTLVLNFERLLVDHTNLDAHIVKHVLGEELVGIRGDVNTLVLQLLVRMVPPEAVKVIGFAGCVDHDQLFVLPQVTRGVRSLLFLVSTIQVEQLNDSLVLFPLPPLRAMLDIQCGAVFPEDLQAELFFVQILRESDDLCFLVCFLQVGAHSNHIVTFRDALESLEVGFSEDYRRFIWTIFSFVALLVFLDKFVRSEIENLRFFLL